MTAYVLQRVAPLFWRPRRELFFASRAVGKPAEIRVPTRHGPVRCLVYRPPAGTPAPGPGGSLPPVYIQIHGGGFTGRFPEQDAHVADFIAADVGAVVVGIDYDVAPQVQFPVAEEECYDVAVWVRESGAVNGWDSGRIAVGGFSAGGKLAINVCQMAHASGAVNPRALVAAFAVADVTRIDRTSVKPHAKISRRLQRVTRESYFADASRRLEPLASPLFDPNLARALPATLIMTGEDDTLAPEMDRLAQTLGTAGVPVVHRRFAATDHGFTHSPPVASAREAIGLIGEHLREAFAVP